MSTIKFFRFTCCADAVFWERLAKHQSVVVEKVCPKCKSISRLTLNGGKAPGAYFQLYPQRIVDCHHYMLGGNAIKYEVGDIVKISPVLDKRFADKTYKIINRYSPNVYRVIDEVEGRRELVDRAWFIE